MSLLRLPEEIRSVVREEDLLPEGLLHRLHAALPRYSALRSEAPVLFEGRNQYVGLEGFREVVAVLSGNGVEIRDVSERELLIDTDRSPRPAASSRRASSTRRSSSRPGSSSSGSSRSATRSARTG